MRVTSLGHASALVELNGRNVLIDPIFGDSFAEGALVPCPARRIARDRLPRIDLVVLTQSEIDHFDIATLAQLPRDCKVVCPDDASIRYALERLGFTVVRPTLPGVRLRLGKFDLMTTPSIRQEGELGVVLQDDTGTFWHQSDTVATSQLVEQVRAMTGGIDLLFAPYAFQSFSFFGSQRAGFPASFLESAIACVRQIAPTLVVPASAGFRYADPLGFANAFVFPISRERFLRELARTAPERRSAIANPGDVFEITKRGVERHEGASPVACMIEDDTRLIEFDPTAHVPPLSDPNLDGYPETVLAGEVAACLDDLEAFVRAGYGSSDPLIAEHRRTGTTYGLGVVFPDGRELWWRCRFGPEAPSVERGEGPVRHALMTHRLPASVVAARARYERRYDFSGGLCRLSFVSAASLVNGKVVLEATEPPDLLFYYLSTRAPGIEHNAKRHLEFSLAPFVHPQQRTSAGSTA